mgnify:CR=1 FL=1
MPRSPAQIAEGHCGPLTDRWACETDFYWQGEHPDNDFGHLGHSVAGWGDFNGDGFPDLVMGSAHQKIEFARSVVHHAAYSCAKGWDSRQLDVSTAKALASDAAHQCGRAALQCHGAIGYTYEYHLHLWLKRAWALGKTFGDAPWHRRRAAGIDLAARMQEELAQLAMEKTRFEVAFQPLSSGNGDDTAPWTERGLDAVEFLLSPNPGEELRPLARIASGGELSRILLALNAVAAIDATAETLVFDEVDAGVGGRVAEVVGRKLRKVAETHQVLCVTHLPQIASFADRHYAVTKREVKGRTVTDVQSLEGPARIDEVARMLGGATITETTRRHAREMVKQSLRS